MSQTNGSFQVTLINPKRSLNQTIRVSSEDYILDIAETKSGFLSCCLLF